MAFIYSDDSNPIPEAIELGYSASHGTILFNELLTDMSKDVLEVLRIRFFIVKSNFTLKIQHAFNNYNNGWLIFSDRGFVDDMEMMRMRRWMKKCDLFWKM